MQHLVINLDRCERLILNEMLNVKSSEPLATKRLNTRWRKRGAKLDMSKQHYNYNKTALYKQNSMKEVDEIVFENSGDWPEDYGHTKIVVWEQFIVANDITRDLTLYSCFRLTVAVPSCASYTVNFSWWEYLLLGRRIANSDPRFTPESVAIDSSSIKHYVTSSNCSTG